MPYTPLGSRQRIYLSRGLTPDTVLVNRLAPLTSSGECDPHSGNQVMQVPSRRVERNVPTSRPGESGRMSARGSNPAPGYGTCSRVRCVRRKPKGWNNGGGTATPRGCWSRESGHAPNCQGKDTCVHGAASAGRHRADRSRLGRKLAVELILSFPWKWLACRPFYDRHRYFPEVWARGLNGRWHFGWIP